MLKSGDRILVHIFSCFCNEVVTRNFGKVFEVKEKDGQQGIDWNTNQSPYTNGGDLFCPFHTFADNVIFEKVDTGEKFHFCDRLFSVVPNTTE